MTKTLEQIQQENRKFILEAIHGCSYEEALKIEEQEIVKNSFFRNNFLIREYIAPENIYIHFGKPLTLSRVLLAISKHGHYDYVWLAGERIDFEFYLKGVSFDLKKETLEEQSEETQRAINEFFNN